MRGIWRLVAPLMIGAAVLAGCGGGDGDEASGPSAGTEANDSESNGSESGGSDSNGNDVSGFATSECLQAVTAYAQAAQGVGQVFSGQGLGLEQSVATLDDFANAAPSEIRDDIGIIVGGYRAFVDALTDAGYDPTSGAPPSGESLNALQAASESLDNEEFEAAAERVADWFEENCSQPG